MLVVRDVFQAKYGRGDELVALFQELDGHWRAAMRRLPFRSFRILTDASGTFFTVVTEMEVDNMAAWEGVVAQELALPQFADWFARMAPLVETGRREFYHLVR